MHWGISLTILTYPLFLPRPFSQYWRKSTLSVAILRLEYARKRRTFNWRRYTVKFSGECSIQHCPSLNTEWFLSFLVKTYDHDHMRNNKSSRAARVWMVVSTADSSTGAHFCASSFFACLTTAAYSLCPSLDMLKWESWRGFLCLINGNDVGNALLYCSCRKLWFCVSKSLS